MPKFLQIMNKQSNLIPTQIYDQSEWDDIRDEIISLFKHGIINRKPIEISEDHFHFLGSIFLNAMEIGLKKTRVKWFAPHFNPDNPFLMVETTNEKIVKGYPYYHALSFGFHYHPQDRLHFFMDIKIPPFLFNMLHETTNDFWESMAQLFSISNSRFIESTVHEDVDKNLLENGKYGFYKLIRYLIATDIKPFSCPAGIDDILGSIELSFDAYMDLDELVDKLSNAVSISNKIYTHLFRKHYLKENKKSVGQKG